jgi:hypothetical protein
LRELSSTASWCNEEPLSWEALAARLGVSRQAIAIKPAVVEAYHSAKKDVAAFKGGSPQAVVRRSLEQRVAEMQKKLDERDRQLNVWIEKWATVEYNCRRYGHDPDKILEPLVKPNRALT